MEPLTRRSELQRLDRDRALALREQLTSSVAVGAVALTGLLMLSAAAGYPGRSDAAGARSVDSTSGSPAGVPDAANLAQPGLNLPRDAPQCCATASAPQAVSGGS